MGVDKHNILVCGFFGNMNGKERGVGCICNSSYGFARDSLPSYVTGMVCLEKYYFRVGISCLSSVYCELQEVPNCIILSFP